MRHVWQANDGSIFDDEKICKEYELGLLENMTMTFKTVREAIASYLDSIDSFEGVDADEMIDYIVKNYSKELSI